MLRNSIRGNQRSVNKKEEIVVRQKELPFVILPKAVFLLKRNPETQRYSLFRLIVLLGYLYSLAMTREKMAKTSYSELKKILNLKSKSTLQELFKFLEREGIVSERVFHFRTSQKTEIILINSMEIPYVAQSWSEEKVREDLVFKVPKLLYILPISPFSKAVYMYLCSLRQYASQSIIRTTTREIREALRMKKKNIILALNELESHSLIKTVRTKKETRIEILPTYKWSSELLSEARELYPDHPLLSTGTNKEPPGTNREPPGTNKEPPGTNREPPGTNKEPQEKHNPMEEKSSKRALEDCIEDKIEDYIEDAANNINNGGGEKNKEEIHSKIKRNQLTEEAEQKNGDTQENAPSYKEPYGSNIKRAESPKLGNLNSGCAVDEQKRAKICRKIAAVADFLKERYPELFRNPTKESISDIYSGVIKTYGEDCGYLLAVMYELMARDKKLGYSSETIKNPNGFLISFVLKDSNSDFGEFFRKFLRKFGLQHVAIPATLKGISTEKDSKLLQELKELLKSCLSSKAAIYRTFVEGGILSIEEKDGIKVVKCKDRIIAEYVTKYLRSYISRLLGEYRRNWIVGS
jgi:hypothetical protein